MTESQKQIKHRSVARLISLTHRVDRVLGFFSSRQNWDPPPPHPRASVPPFGFGGGGHIRLRERGAVESQFGRGDRHCGTLGIYVLCGLTWTLENS
jgi:hypothetical protein